jgi:hypothetical protein
MIAAGIMLGQPIIPHHNCSRPPFHPHLVLRVVDVAIKMTKHDIGFIGCQLNNRFGKGRIQLTNTGISNGSTGSHVARKFIFKRHNQKRYLRIKSSHYTPLA